MAMYDWTYQVEEVTDVALSRYEVLACARNVCVAIAAYEEACRNAPDKLIRLCNGARIMRQSDRENKK